MHRHFASSKRCTCTRLNVHLHFLFTVACGHQKAQLHHSPGTTILSEATNLAGESITHGCKVEKVSSVDGAVAATWRCVCGAVLGRSDLSDLRQRAAAGRTEELQANNLRTPDEIHYASVPRGQDLNYVCLKHGQTLVLVASKHQIYGSYPVSPGLLGVVEIVIRLVCTLL
jgi:hypothetical protein